MKITSWNVNSVRTRLPHVLNWWDATRPDVLCLQETKVINADFPYEPFEERGLYIYHHGQKAYNGVALISQEPLTDVQTGFHTGDLNEQTRVIAGTTATGVRVLNLYIPQGESVDSPKFAFKRAFYAALQDELDTRYTADQPLVVLGDFNVAPAAADVDNVEKRHGKCMFTDEEHGWLAALKQWGLHDALRLTTNEDKLFSWWDYRQLAFQQNRGMRIDLIYVTDPLVQQVQQVEIFREERKREKPSDHAPVMLTLG